MAIGFGPWSGFGGFSAPGFGGFGVPGFGGFGPNLGGGFGLPYGASMPSFWWGAPVGVTDFDLYDYNNNFVLDDNEIADLVMDNIHLDPLIPLSDERNLRVDVKDGVVTLSGTVRNPRVRPLAYADAFWSPGVVDVIDNIHVEPMQRAGAEGRGTPGGRRQQQAGGQQQEGGSAAPRRTGSGR